MNDNIIMSEITKELIATKNTGDITSDAVLVRAKRVEAQRSQTPSLKQNKEVDMIRSTVKEKPKFDKNGVKLKWQNPKRLSESANIVDQSTSPTSTQSMVKPVTAVERQNISKACADQPAKPGTTAESSTWMLRHSTLDQCFSCRETYTEAESGKAQRDDTGSFDLVTL